MTTKKKILYLGCSFTAKSPDSGFNLKNHSEYHWTNKLARYYQADYDNLGIGGMSNNEIYYRTIEHCLYQKYDLIVIMWTSLARQWIYFNHNNIDDFTGFTPERAFGFNSSLSEAQLFYKLYYSTFQNYYIELKHWLLNIISLSSFLFSRKQPFVFIKGFENFILDFNLVTKNQGFNHLSNDLKQILDFDNRPDDYILNKITVIKNLIDQIKDLPWVNLSSDSFYCISEDVADDGLHPGPISNEKLSSLVMQYIDSQNLL